MPATGRLQAATEAAAAAAEREAMRLGWDEVEEEQRRAERAALAGREVPCEHLKTMPHRTLTATGIQFKHYRSLAVTGRPFSVCCVPVLSPVGRAATWW